jgi:Ser/Thr protein kinase RdoA (MazF antagonist)
VATRGAAALLEWADGEPLQAAQCRPDVMEALGAVHAELHRVTLRPPHGREGPATPGWPARLARYLDELVSRDAVDRTTRDRAQALAGSAMPGAFPVGLVHKDFCRENMVVSPDAVIRVVDNETLAVDCPDYDLTRTWYRWPMDPPQADAYLEGYRRLQGRGTLARHFPFWAVAVLAESALFRLRRELPAAALPLARLRELLDRHAASGERPAFVERRGPGPPAAAAP